MTQEFDTKLIDQLLEGRTTPEDITGEHGLLKQLTKVLLERALQAEMTHHLGHAHGEAVVSDLKAIYKAPTEQAAEAGIEAFAAQWDAKYPSTSQSWRRNWSRVIPCFSYSRTQ